MMKTLNYLFVLYFLLTIAFYSCKDSTLPNDTNKSDLIEFGEAQLKTAIAELEQVQAVRFPGTASPMIFPRSLRDDSLFYVRSRDWTSGFFGGNLWHMYELTNNDYWKEQAIRFTAPIEQEKTNKGTHDLGFMIYCSFGNGYRLTGNEQYKEIAIEAARSLSTRFNPTVGCIRSWDHNSDKWMYPVIIDNMMNLELLFWASKVTGDSSFYKIAIKHADTTLKNHFREDGSSYHVIDYDPASGEVRNKHTHQGFSHESAWARGQAWGLYGYTMSFRETGKKEYLEQAEKIAAFMLNHPNLPEDLVPYWDYNAPDMPGAPRDVSAATIMCSALFELADLVEGNSDYYQSTAIKILDNVSTHYRSSPGANKGFLLDHSTGHLPGKHEIDVPLVYADYYYLEAIKRKGS